MKILLKLAACGFLLSALLHGVSLIGINIQARSFVIGLFFFLLIIWIPTCTFFHQVSRYSGRRHAQRIILSACPAWMRLWVNVTLGYAMLNIFFLSITADPSKNPIDDSSARELRMFSAFMMSLYGFAFASLYSRIHAPHLYGTRESEDA